MNSLSIDEQTTLLRRKEEKLQRWEEDLRQREFDLQDKISKMTELHSEVTRKKAGKKESRGRDCIRKTHLAESILLIRERTIYVHKKHNIGTSSNLLLLMIVMRDLSFLNENVEACGFLRLLMEWKVIDIEEKDIRSIASSMSQARNRLPERGRMDLGSDEWQKKQYSVDKEMCDKLAADFLTDDKINRIHRLSLLSN